MAEKIILKDEIRSTVSSKTVYASAGEEIQVLKWMDDVAICLGKNGRFPANKKKLFPEPEIKKVTQISLFV